jgi:hypothetical protein
MRREIQNPPMFETDPESFSPAKHFNTSVILLCKQQCDIFTAVPKLCRNLHIMSAQQSIVTLRSGYILRAAVSFLKVVVLGKGKKLLLLGHTS